MVMPKFVVAVRVCLSVVEKIPHQNGVSRFLSIKAKIGKIGICQTTGGFQIGKVKPNNFNTFKIITFNATL